MSVETEALHSMSTHSTGLLYMKMLLSDGKPLRMPIDNGATVNVKKEMHIADALSRVYLSDGNDRQEQFSQINTIKQLAVQKARQK